MSRRRTTGPLLDSARLFITAQTVFDGERMLEGSHDILVDSGIVRSVTPASAGPAESIHAGAVAPGFVDAHVHLSFSDASEVARGGVTGVLDLGAPRSYAFSPHPPLRYRTSGPMLTATRGYPTQSWGAGGYGLEIDNAVSARRAVGGLKDDGVAMIKVAIQGEPGLDPGALRAIVDEASARDLRVAAHALDDASVRLAIDAGIEVLAHTPVEHLEDAVVKALGARSTTVISTVRAFGGTAAARDNLVRLAAAGCEVVYGTDLGNGAIRPGLDAAECAIIEAAVGSRNDVLRAATSAAARLAGIPGGRIEVGRPADLVLAASLTYKALAHPDMVLIGGIPIQ